jgi:hypothetical protein
MPKLAIGLILLVTVAGAALLAPASLATPSGSPEVTASKSWTFTGRGTKRIGTIALRRTATLRWRKGRGTLRITGTRGFRLLETRSRRGSITIRRGTYRRLTASAPSSWRITIRERR